MNDDAEMLRRYAEEGYEPAFTELVRRHVDLVYGAALRRTGGDVHRAADVAQQVFTALARDARKLSRHTMLPAWLHTATRNAALNLMISEQRRLARETEALALESAGVAGRADPEWSQLQPLLDGAIDELPEIDRAAVILRFLERRPFAEIGAALKVSEDAARVRTDRALEKLRGILARHGISSTGAALGGIMAGLPLVAAPAGLATALALESIAAAGAGVSAVAAFSFMSTKLITTAAVSALLAFGVGIYAGRTPEPSSSALQPSPETARQAQLIASLQQDKQRLTAEATGLNLEVARMRAAEAEQAGQAARRSAAPVTTRTKSPNIGVPLYEQQTMTLNNLRQINAARKQFHLENGRAAGSITDLVGVGRYIKTVRTVGGEDYSALSMEPDQPLTVTTPDGVSVTFDPTGATTTQPEIPPAVVHEQKVQAAVMKAVEAYRAAHSGANPPNEAAIVSYFATPQEGADFVELMESRKKPKKP
jgi:RNA polymerase sigma factor (sigma-70 family)